MKTKREYILDLELDPVQDYSDSELKKQYKKLSLKYHEDKTGNSEKHRLIVEAYDSLKNGVYAPEERPSLHSISIEDLHDSLFSMINRSAMKIDLKKNDNKMILINNTLINLDASKLTKSKTVFIEKGLYRIER